MEHKNGYNWKNEERKKEIEKKNKKKREDDNLNNDWRVYIDGININEFHLIMFNRWGEIVWESYDPEGVWDGTYVGNKNQDGTYVWTLIAKDATSDKKYEFKGQVTVIR